MAIEKNLKRVTMNLPVNLVEKIDKYAEKMSISRTMAIVLLCSDQLYELEKGSVENG